MNGVGQGRELRGGEMKAAGVKGEGKGTKGGERDSGKKREGDG